MMTLSRWKLILVAMAVVFGLLFALPNVLPQTVRDNLPGFMPRETLNLGLDLQGGSYLLLEVDTDALRTERLTNMVEDIRSQLGKSGLLFPGWAWSGDRWFCGLPIRLKSRQRPDNCVRISVRLSLAWPVAAM